MADKTFQDIAPDSPSAQKTPSLPNEPGKVGPGYEILVQDHLDPRWLEWFEGWTITNREDGVVALRCPQVDQSALHGALNKIRDLNLVLLSVTRM
jgi:hypothetical protein